MCIYNIHEHEWKEFIKAYRAFNHVNSLGLGKKTWFVLMYLGRFKKKYSSKQAITNLISHKLLGTGKWIKDNTAAVCEFSPLMTLGMFYINHTDHGAVSHCSYFLRSTSSFLQMHFGYWDFLQDNTQIHFGITGRRQKREMKKAQCQICFYNWLKHHFDQYWDSVSISVNLTVKTFKKPQNKLTKKPTRQTNRKTNKQTEIFSMLVKIKNNCSM